MIAVLRRATARPWLLTAVVAVLVVAGVLSYVFTRGGTSAAATPTYRLVAAATGTIRQSISTTGTIEPAAEDAMNFAVSGLVTAVDVTQGQSVTAGEVLATVDSAAARATLAQAQASLASAQSRLTTDTDNGAAATTITADQAAVTAAQAQVSSAQSALSQASLTSPIAGVVASVNLTVGQQVSGSSGSSSSGSGSSGGAGSTGSGTSGSGTSGSGSTGSTSSSGSSTAQVLVVSTDSWIVNCSVDDTQVGLVATGDQAEITPDGATTPVYGTISSVALIATSSSGVASYPVVIAVTGSPTGLHAGATATVSLIYKQLSNVLTVPTAAVHASSGQSYVNEMSGGKQVRHDITVGTSAGGQTQVKSGLADGDEVVVPVIGARVGTRTNTGTGTRTGGGFTGGGFGGGGTGGGFGGGFGGGGAGG